ncbi:MAG TPA: CBS domain-containing protein [Rhodocyclaceae bacterium]|nr:CBS domain-containing protein [Rhodocyclaceae bacterium]
MTTRPIRQIIQGKKVVTASPDVSVADAAIAMRNARVGALAILEDEKLVGIFTERDALFRVLANGMNPSATKLEYVMTSNPQTITPNRPVSHAMHMMHEGGYRHMPVVENGYLVGMISVRDALVPELREFEEELDSRDHLFEVIA